MPLFVENLTPSRQARAAVCSLILVCSVVLVWLGCVNDTVRRL
jgi:hypothetical protein